MRNGFYITELWKKIPYVSETMDGWQSLKPTVGAQLLCEIAEIAKLKHNKWAVCVCVCEYNLCIAANLSCKYTC